MRRRDALVLGTAAAIAIAIPPLLRRLPARFDFTPLRGAPGFQRLDLGAAATGFDPLLGLSDPDGSSGPGHQGDLCASLFGPLGWREAEVPVAVFTDVNCPYCRAHEQRLQALVAEGSPIRLVWHELPLLGPSSVRAARALLAADLLGAQDAVRRYLASHVLRPGPVALAEMAEATGMDASDFVRRVAEPHVDQRLAEGLALGRRLGIPGTPGTVIGRTLVIGALRPADLAKLIDLELTKPRDACL